MPPGEVVGLAGPHLENTSELNPPGIIRLESVAGAYWRGDDKLSWRILCHGQETTPEQS